MKFHQIIINYFISFYFNFQFSNLTFLEGNSKHDFETNKSNNLKFIPLNRSEWSENFVMITALVDKTVTLTCSIEIDEIHFLKSENYKIIWSREDENGRDYEPLGLDDIRLIPDERINFERIHVSTQKHEKIKWNLMINYLKQSDSRNYICQLNKRPYDTLWLKKFNLNVNEPAYFVEESEKNQLKLMSKSENDLFLKSVIEHEDLKLKCNAKGKPLPIITWYIKFLNGTSLELDNHKSELVVKGIKRSFKINLVECQAGNGYGAKAIRLFKINLKYAPKIFSSHKTFQVPLSESEYQLNCSILSNPLPKIFWFFKKRENFQLRKLQNESSENNLISEWKPLNLHASYSIKHSTNIDKSSMAQISLSKYHINEKHLRLNFIVSSILIKRISESDLGTYKCIAINEVANSTIEFTLKRMNRHILNMDKMRSLSSEKYATTKKIYRLNFKNYKNKVGTDLSDNESSIMYNFCPNNRLIILKPHNFLYIFFFFKIFNLFNKYL